jgi:hypothetical protein
MMKQDAFRQRIDLGIIAPKVRRRDLPSVRRGVAMNKSARVDPMVGIA